MYRLVQSFAERRDPIAVTLDGRSFPTPALLEDDADGARVLLLAETTVPTAVWLAAHTAGAVALVRAEPASYALAERFVAHRVEHRRDGRFELPAQHWTPATAIPGYLDMLAPTLPSPTGFVAVHNHSEFSQLDGLSRMDEMVSMVLADNQPGLALTDHGTCAGHPDLQKAAREWGFTPIFGEEFYFCDDISMKDPDNKYYHLILWALDDEGLRNLWALSTESMKGLYYKPRIDWGSLSRLNTGIAASTACLGGPVLRPWQRGQEDRALANLARLGDVFGDRLYVEVQTAQTEAQVAANHWLVRHARNLGVPLIAAVDSHYPRAEDRDAHQAWLRVVTSKDDTEEMGLFTEGEFHMLTQTEVRDNLSYLGVHVVDEAVGNTAALAARCSAEIKPKPALPVYSRPTETRPDPVAHDAERLIDLCLSRWAERTVSKPHAQEDYEARFEEEMNLLLDKKFCFPPETEVLMGDGSLRPIDQIGEGEMVLTREGPQPVGQVITREVDEDLVELTVAGSYRILRGTGNHPVLTSQGFRELDAIETGEEVAVDVRMGIDTPFGLIELARSNGWSVREQCEGGRDGFVRMGPGRWDAERAKKGWGPQQVAPTEALMYLVGLWVAQGHLYDPDGGTNPGQVFWTMHEDDTEVHARLVAALKVMRFGDPRIYSKASASAPEHKGVTYAVTNHPLALLLLDQVGCGSRSKRLGSWITSLSPESLAPFVAGWFDGDGTSSRSRRKIVDTANRMLSFQLRQILLAAGIWAIETTHDWEGRTYYRVSWTPERFKRPYNARWDGHRWWVKVLAVERSHYQGLVHNLSVAGDPTYIAEGVRVHNCGYFLMSADVVRHAKAQGILVGPGRGSGGGSLVAYLTGITEIDPVEHGLLFARFMTPGRVEPPDFDIDFPSSAKPVIFEYTKQRWGAEHVCMVGTHLRLKNKGVIKNTAQAMKSRLPADYYPHIEAVSKIIAEAESTTAGLGLSWEELWAQVGDILEPYRQKYPELFRMAGKLHGRLKSYGKHAAGVVIDPDVVLNETLPLRLDDNGELVTQFDLEALTALGHLKFDFLNLGTLDTIQTAVDLVREQTGNTLDVYRWRGEYADPIPYEQLGEGWTMGVFQLDTSLGTRMVKRFKPSNLAELADVITLVRPGPRNSGLTDMYFRRRNGEEEVAYPDPRLADILSKTYGAMLYQEDIMEICMALAGYSSTEADTVRKILGKKKVELAKVEGQKFLARAAENGTDPTVAGRLWAQMEEFSRYAFNRSHAFAYAVLGLWTVWLKCHYPLQFLTALLCTVDKDKIPAVVGEAQRMGYAVLPPDINESKVGFTMGRGSVRYGLASVKGIGPAVVEAIVPGQPYTSWPDFLERKGPACNAGHLKTLAHIGAFDSLVPNRRGLELLLVDEAATGSHNCVHHDEAAAPLPCAFAWDTWIREHPNRGRTGKLLKVQPTPPTRCTVRCRHYTPTPTTDPAGVAPYADAEVRAIEVDELGVWLSSSPFQAIPEEDREWLATAHDILVGPFGSYHAAAIVKSVRVKEDRTGNKFAFVTLATERGDFECVVFSKFYQLYKGELRKNALVLVEVTKNSRGQQLAYLAPLS